MTWLVLVVIGGLVSALLFALNPFKTEDRLDLMTLEVKRRIDLELAQRKKPPAKLKTAAVEKPLSIWDRLLG